MEKTAIISGANGALGSVLVQKFLNNSYYVAGLYHSQVETFTEKNFNGYTVNLLDEDATSNTVQEIISKGSKIDVLVCTAGGFASGNIDNTHNAELQKQYQLNFLTAYNLVQPVYLQMKKQGYGKIFLVGSQQGLTSYKATNAIAYGLSKSLLFHLAEILNKDSHGKVIISVVVPSIIDTKANRESMPDEDFSKWVTPEEIANIILFYSSDAANAIREPILKIFK